MLTLGEKDYLSKIPEGKIVRIWPHNPKVSDIVEFIRSEIKSAGIDHDVHWIGASALGIAGQNDLDLHIFVSPKERGSLALKIEEILGPRKPKTSIYMWELIVEGLSVEFYLSDPESKGMKSQLQVFKALQNSKKLQKEYEELKLQFHEKSFRDYMKAKFEFFHKVSGE